MAQQTAVEWLIKEFCKNGIDIGSGYKVAYEIPKELIEQAKEMEREQKIEFADRYVDDVMGGCNLRAEQYYNETYNK
jgi:hypothetical protein